MKMAFIVWRRRYKMKLKNKAVKILIESIPILLMILLIPFVKNDYLLAGIYMLIIVVSFFIKYEKRDYVFFIFGLIVLTISESIFISTGVETFERNSLFGLMPLWLPVLWAYAFVVIKRTINILK